MLPHAVLACTCVCIYVNHVVYDVLWNWVFIESENYHTCTMYTQRWTTRTIVHCCSHLVLYVLHIYTVMVDILRTSTWASRQFCARTVHLVWGSPDPLLPVHTIEHTTITVYIHVYTYMYVWVGSAYACTVRLTRNLNASIKYMYSNQGPFKFCVSCTIYLLLGIYVHV